MKEVCEELEKEKPDDSQEVKNARFDQILGLMQKVIISTTGKKERERERNANVNLLLLLL